MTQRPRRVSMGCYVVENDGKQIILRRVGRRGFRIEHSPGRAYVTIKRLRDAVTVALDSVSPWPFNTPMEPLP